MGLSTHYEANLVALIKQLRVQVTRRCSCCSCSCCSCGCSFCFLLLLVLLLLLLVRLLLLFFAAARAADVFSPLQFGSPKAKFVTASLGQTAQVHKDRCSCCFLK